MLVLAHHHTRLRALSLSLSLRHSLLLKSLTRLFLKHTHTHTQKPTIAAKAQNTVKPETWQKFPLNAKDFSDNPSSSSSSSSSSCDFVCVRRAAASLVLWATSNCRNYAQGGFCALKMRIEHVRSCSSTVFVFQIWACWTTSSVRIQCKSWPKSSTLSTVWHALC
jgi:hypothetical protein